MRLSGTKGGQHLSTILIVDDERSLRFLVRVILENEGYDVVEAHHGAVALERVQESRPDLIMIDLMMPVMGGRELIERLRSDPQVATIPIVVLSANADLVADMADAALSKPFDVDLLLETVQTLSQKGAAR